MTGRPFTCPDRPAPTLQHKLAGIIGLSCYLPLLEEKPIVSGASQASLCTATLSMHAAFAAIHWHW